MTSGVFPASNTRHRSSPTPPPLIGAVRNITIGEINRRHVADLMAEGHEAPEIIKITGLSFTCVNRHIAHIIHLMGE